MSTELHMPLEGFLAEFFQRLYPDLYEALRVHRVTDVKVTMTARRTKFVFPELYVPQLHQHEKNLFDYQVDSDQVCKVVDGRLQLMLIADAHDSLP